MFESRIRQLRKLERASIVIDAKGVYSDRKRTRVHDVAIYQNYGTDTIKPAKFVERAIKRHRSWRSPLAKAVFKYVRRNSVTAMRMVGIKIARDMNNAVNRIDTGRLRHSFTYKLLGL